MSIFRRLDANGKHTGPYQARYKDFNGRWQAKTLNTTDPTTARLRFRELERRAADPAHNPKDTTTLMDAIDAFMISRRAKGVADGTYKMYEQKTAHLVRLWGAGLPLSSVDAPRVDRYLVTRLGEGASRNTIGKELTALRGVLRTAKRAKKFAVDLGEVLPEEWATDYEPRKTALTPEQVDRLVAHLAAPPSWTKRSRAGREYAQERRDGEAERRNKAAFVAFLVATGARLSEGAAATRGQIDLEKGLVYFRITKTRKKGKREKFVPVTRLTRPLLEYVLKGINPTDALGASGAWPSEQSRAASLMGQGIPNSTARLFRRWGNITRDLARACAELGIPRVTPNDLRRTHANWLVNAGVDTHLVANVLGHVDSRMVEKVYGRLRPEQLRDRVMEMVH